MSDQPVTVEIETPGTAAMSVDIIYMPSMAVDITVDGSLPVTAPENVSLDVSVEGGEVVLPAISGGGMTLELVYGGIKGDRGDPGGVTVTRTANGDIGGHRVVVQNADGSVSYASSDNAGHAGRVLGVSAGAASSGAEIPVQTMDVISEASWSWTPDMPVYLGLNGLLAQDVSSVGLFVLVIGVALSATRVFINIQMPVFK